MEYFLLTGYFSSLIERDESGKRLTNVLSPSRQLPYFRNEHNEGIGLLPVLETHGDISNLYYLVTAPRIEQAYFFAHCLKALFSIVYGQHRLSDDFDWLLLRLSKKPASGIQESELKTLICYADKRLMLADIFSFYSSCTYIRREINKHSRVLYSKLVRRLPLMHALLNLDFSYTLVPCISNYYEYEEYYENDEEALDYASKKAYFENKLKYDLAFLSAFRAIESLLGTEQIKKQHFENLFKQLDHENATDFSKSNYELRFPTSSINNQVYTYVGFAKELLVYRNSVAAHWNPNNKNKLISDLIVCEIQHYVRSILERCINNLLGDNEHICITIPSFTKSTNAY